MKKIRVAIIGAGGYGGCGAIEFLIGHPNAELAALIDINDAGKPISSIYPHLAGFCDMPIIAPNDPNLSGDFDIVFFATPDGIGQKEAESWLTRGIKVIDYSGDFRFNNPVLYKGYAERIGRLDAHASPGLLPSSVYGLAELHRTEISHASLVGNPGCFAVSCILGLAPAVKESLINTDFIICDAKTGVSGAGKKPSPTFHYPARYDCINAYKISGHQHVFEIERELKELAGKDITVTFTPHVIPMARGILSTIYAPLSNKFEFQDVIGIYRNFYDKSPFIRVYGPEVPQMSTNVRGSNFCNLSLNFDPRTGNIIIVSHIDNLVKGQAGSAVQNMNIMFGLCETTGLLRPGSYP